MRDQPEQDIPPTKEEEAKYYVLIRAYGDVIESTVKLRGEVFDISWLPASKEEIKKALTWQLQTTDFKDPATVVYGLLCQFQPEVGQYIPQIMPQVERKFRDSFGLDNDIDVASYLKEEEGSGKFMIFAEIYSELSQQHKSLMKKWEPIIESERAKLQQELIDLGYLPEDFEEQVKKYEKLSEDQLEAIIEVHEKNLQDKIRETVSSNTPAPEPSPRSILALQRREKFLNWNVVLGLSGFLSLAFYLRSKPLGWGFIVSAAIWTLLFYIAGYLCREYLSLEKISLNYIINYFKNNVPAILWRLNGISTDMGGPIVIIWIFSFVVISKWTEGYYLAQHSFAWLYFICLIWVGITFFIGWISHKIACEEDEADHRKKLFNSVPNASLVEQMACAVANEDDRWVEELISKGIFDGSSRVLAITILLTTINDQSMDNNKRLDIMGLILDWVTVEEINEKDSKGWTPLMVAAENLNHWGIGALMLHGADPSIENNEGRTARDIAAKRDGYQILEIFDKQWALNLARDELQTMHSTGARMRKIEEEKEKAKEVPPILECYKGLLSYSVLVGVFLAFLSTVLI